MQKISAIKVNLIKIQVGTNFPLNKIDYLKNYKADEKRWIHTNIYDKKLKDIVFRIHCDQPNREIYIIWRNSCYVPMLVLECLKVIFKDQGYLHVITDIMVDGKFKDEILQAERRKYCI
jgi:hypothetical protein